MRLPGGFFHIKDLGPSWDCAICGFVFSDDRDGDDTYRSLSTSDQPNENLARPAEISPTFPCFDHITEHIWNNNTTSSNEWNENKYL